MCNVQEFLPPFSPNLPKFRWYPAVFMKNIRIHQSLITNLQLLEILSKHQLHYQVTKVWQFQAPWKLAGDWFFDDPGASETGVLVARFKAGANFAPFFDLRFFFSVFCTAPHAPNNQRWTWCLRLGPKNIRTEECPKLMNSWCFFNKSLHFINVCSIFIVQQMMINDDYS